jgi:hypothetical protein
VLLVLTAGCVTTADQPTETTTRNATLSLTGYDRTASASPVETRLVWDRSESWENPGEQNVTIVSRAHAYRGVERADTVVVYTTPAEQYVGPDHLRSMSASRLAALATRSVDAQPVGTTPGGNYTARLLGDNTTVRTLSDAETTRTTHVAYTVDDQTFVVVVVSGETDRSTVGRVLEGVRLPEHGPDSRAS